MVAAKLIRIRILARIGRSGADTTDTDPVAVVRAMYPYIERELSQSVSGAYHSPYAGVVQVSPARDSGVAI